MGSFLQTLQRLGPMRLTIIGGVLLALIGSFSYLGTRLTAPTYKLLYTDLDLKDSSQIVTKLDSLGIPYELHGDGATIDVPADQVGRARLSMAELGIPRGGSVGYELFDKSDALGATNFQQGVNEMRALEGELARTIQSLSVVESARVHLVLPKRELFSRETQEPSASIVLKTRRSEPLSKSQIAAVQNLVASAVPGLKTTRISIIDQSGNLLARGNGDANDVFAMGSSAEEQRVAYESKVSGNVENMLERSLGFGRVRVDVNADMDFDKVTTSQESYDPDGQVVRSTQTSNDANESGQPSDQAVTVQNNLPPDGQQSQTSAPNTATRSKETKTDETTNYEISKKVTSQVREAGVVKRLSVAVLVDGTYAPDGDHAYQPRSAEELASLTKLVQSAIGYDEKRGDRVEVVNMRFAEAPEAMAEPTILLGLGKADLIRIGESIGIAIVAIIAILFVVRPIVNRALQPPGETAMTPSGQRLLTGPDGAIALTGPDGMPMLPGATGTALVPVVEEAESMIDIGQVEGRVRASSMKKIGEIVEKHPEEAVAIIRSWMYQAA